MNSGSYATGKGNQRIDKRIRNKWWKLITLVNNPVLVIERLHKRVEEEKQKKPGLRVCTSTFLIILIDFSSI